MKAFFCAMALSLGLVGLTGCETLIDTPGENFTRMVHSTSTTVRQIPSDAERHLLLDRPIWLSREPIPNE